MLNFDFFRIGTRMQALQRHVPRPLAQIIGQYAAFKWCWVDGLHGDVGPRGCCCAKCATCGRATRKPSKQGVKIITMTYPEGRICYLKQWICGSGCVIEMLSNEISAVYIINKYGGIIESDYLTGYQKSYMMIYARNAHHVHEIADALEQHHDIVWRASSPRHDSYEIIMRNCIKKLRWGQAFIPTYKESLSLL